MCFVSSGLSFLSHLFFFFWGGGGWGGGSVVVVRFDAFLFADLVHISFLSGKSSGLASSTKRSSSLLRPTSPKSPVASASAFESVEGSDDEDNMTDNAKLDITYLHTNGNAVSLLCTYNFFFFLIILFIFYNL
jgi:hypothetical protein